jgi:hypothetical protein
MQGISAVRLNQDDIVEIEGTFYAKRPQLTAQAQTLYREFLQWRAQQKSGRESKPQAKALTRTHRGNTAAGSALDLNSCSRG